MAALNLVTIRRLGFVNAYLVAEDDGLTLVDTAVKGSAKAILAAAQRLGRPVLRILLTHAHVDHVGSLDALSAALPGVEVMISARDARLLAGDKRAQPGEPGDAKLRGGYPGAATAPTRTLSDGDRIGSLEVIASPGHTPGHLSFLDTRDGTLLAGDAWASLGGVSVPSKPHLRFPIPWLATWHRPTALASARRLRELEPRRLAPGHGPVVAAPLAAMDSALAAAA